MAVLENIIQEKELMYVKRRKTSSMKNILLLLNSNKQTSKLLWQKRSLANSSSYHSKISKTAASSCKHGM